MNDLHRKEVVTCEEMKALETAADKAGLSYYQMMEMLDLKPSQRS